jgi:CHAT domain-containing protein
MQGLTPLPATQTEIELIYTHLKDASYEAEMLFGKNANKKNIKELYKPRVLHIATHGFFQIANLDVENKEDLLKYNPLWRSGVVLSVATNSKETDNKQENINEGILTAYEAMNLNLDSKQLVVLFACETGLGEIKNGEGVYGLQRAFKVAGAKNIIMSLWKVDDVATQELMTLFYDNWLKMNNSRKAFTATQQELRKKYPQPYYWGAFVLVGE